MFPFQECPVDGADESNKRLERDINLKMWLMDTSPRIGAAGRRKAIRTTQHISIVGQASLCAGNQSRDLVGNAVEGRFCVSRFGKIVEVGA